MEGGRERAGRGMEVEGGKRGGGRGGEGRGGEEGRRGGHEEWARGRQRFVACGLFSENCHRSDMHQASSFITCVR